MLPAEFQLPLAFDLVATSLFAITGALAGMRSGYDIIGVFALAFTTAVGGGLIRDGIFIQAGPPTVLTELYYIPVIMAAVLGTIVIGRFVPPVRRILSGVPAPAVRAELPYETDAQRNSRVAFQRSGLERRLTWTYATVLSLVDALGLGIYAVVGAQKSLNAGLSVLAAILVGTINAVGGGLLRDVLTREVPLLFKPGQFYALTALVGCICFVVLATAAQMEVERAAFLAIGLTFLLRLLAIRFDWRSRAVTWYAGQSDSMGNE